MARVFISYSRKDIEFAKRLTAELQKCELDFWIDWEGIPPTVDWWKEIQKGIEEADIFLCLISPDSAKSKVCGQEIDTAVKNGKRLIPVVVREIEWQDTPPQLGHLNYIFFSREDDFQTATNKLLQAIQTDYAWAATHRRLQVKALEWARNHQEISFLLRGKDLREAELQLATNTSKEPHPTDLQRSYVFKSRYVTDRQRRFITRISIASAIAMAALTVFAFIQLRIARAQNLGAQAQVAFAEQDFATAGLYAYQSNQIHENDDADLILAKLPYEKFLIGKRLLGHTYDVGNVAWSKDGRLASMDYRGKIIIWDITTGRPSQTLDTKGFYIVDLAWSPNGRLASVGGFPSDITIWNPATGQPEQTLKYKDTSVYPTKIIWLNDDHLASGDSTGTVTIWDLSKSQPSQTLKAHTGQISSLAWSSDGRLASGSNDKTIIVWDLATGQPAQTLKGSTNSIESLAWSTNGRLASSDRGYQITIWDLSTDKPAQILKDHFSDFTSVAWSNDGKLASGSTDSSVLIWDLATGLPAEKLSGHGDQVESVAWSPDGRLASASDDTSVLIWDFSHTQPMPTLTGHTDKVSDVAWSADGRLASASDDSTVILWNIYTGKPALVLKGHTGPVTSVAWSKDGRLASGSRDKTIIIWDLKNGQPMQVLNGHDPVIKVAWSADGRLVSSSANTTIIWDVASGQPTQIMKGGHASWSATGQLAYAFENSTIDTIFVRRTPSEPAYTLKSKTLILPDLAWSANGRLASTQYDFDAYTRAPIFSVVIWNLDTRRPAQTLLGSKGLIYSNAWSADGKLASAYSDVDDQRYEVILWDLANGVPAQILKGHTNEINSLAWSTQGYLASASTDRTIKIARPELIRGNPCDWISRNMTTEEWVKYQGAFYVYKPACPDLPVPGFSLDNLDLFQTIQALFITWQGRTVILAVVFVILFVVAVLIWTLRLFITWLWPSARSTSMGGKS